MDAEVKLRELLKEYIGSKSIASIARESGIHVHGVHNILKGRIHCPRESTIKAICSALQKDPNELLRFRGLILHNTRTDDIISLRKQGLSLREIGERYNISNQRVGQIIGKEAPTFYCRACKKTTMTSKYHREFCSRKCEKIYISLLNEYRQLFSHIDFNPDSNGCLNWTSTKTAAGYGRTSRNQRYAHREIWEMTNRKIPDNMMILHHCDNPSCCNPAHLFLGTHADNMKDRDAKGRGKSPILGKGEDHPTAKLTDSDVIQIRQLLNDGKTKTEIGRIFRVSFTTIHNIAIGERWTHVPESKDTSCKYPT